ncbi:ubiquitin carboxyl-terminal hydrolase 38-like [Elysia marginata]|uniref:Ubiquitin carboxyl-terminal hydrolase 38-like n=1 Tax=Elysia marginata TaxID=1093978 RepID=A0AAV4GL06_9GAST|nr:ubiquitin carboxyl-terminal hydrolase 38-like [Elysia marginata]
MQCLMYLHSGFPELYDPVLELIKDCPTLTQDEMKAKLQQSSWLSQVSGSVALETGSSTASYALVTTQKKLEEGKTGLDNLVNTCYMNSILQALYMCDQFRHGILSKVPSSQESVLDKLQHVFALLCQSNRASISPSRLLQASRPPWFLPGQQQDCSEFLKYLLDRLHEDERGQPGVGETGTLMRSLSTSSSGSSVSPGGTLKKSERKAAVTLTSIKMKTDDEISGTGGQGSNCPSLVESTFRGKMKTTLRCLACKAESTRSESFSDIPLAFPNSAGLADGFPQKSLAGGGTQAGLSAEITSVTQEDKAGAADSKESAKSTSTAQASTVIGDKVQPVSSPPTNGPVADGESNCTDSLSLNDLIDYYLKSEQLTGDNKYHCDKCGKLQDGERSITISESPNYLILTLLRFSYNTKLQSRTKIFQDVRYPRTLALPVDKSCRSTLTSSASSSSLSKQHSRTSSSSSGSTHTYNMLSSEHAHNTLHSEKLKQLAERLSQKTEAAVDQQPRELYGLSAVVIHSGTSSECGHYYCYARHSCSGQVDPALLDKTREDEDSVDLLPDKWYNFNDNRVSHANFEGFSNVTKRFSKDTAYVLIYRKLDPVPKAVSPSLEPVLRPELRDFVIKDNETFLKEQELEARVREEQRRRSSSVDSAKFNNWNNKNNDNDDDDNDSYRGPGCNPGMDGGHDTSGSRFVF